MSEPPPSLIPPCDSFNVGQVKATGMLRVSSTEPYFVDDRLYSPETLMQDCKPVELHVSCGSISGSRKTRSGDGLCAAKAETGECIGAVRHISKEGLPALNDSKAVSPSPSPSPSDDTQSGGPIGEPDATSDVEGKDSVLYGGELTPPVVASKDEQPIPWVLDICLVR